MQTTAQETVRRPLVFFLDEPNQFSRIEGGRWQGSTLNREVDLWHRRAGTDPSCVITPDAAVL
jgi:hypothetical protein